MRTARSLTDTVSHSICQGGVPRHAPLPCLPPPATHAPPQFHAPLPQMPSCEQNDWQKGVKTYLRKLRLLAVISVVNFKRRITFNKDLDLRWAYVMECCIAVYFQDGRDASQYVSIQEQAWSPQAGKVRTHRQLWGKAIEILLSS